MPDDIRIPSTPPPPQQPPPATDEAPPPPNASVESVPPNIDDITQLLKIRGEVFQARADGIVRIMTDQGEIVVRLDPRETPPPGTKVQVEVYPGNPPTAARVTPERVQAPPPRLSDTPVEIIVRPQQSPNAPNTPAADVPVRLEPITVEQALAYVTEPLETITATIQAATEATTRLISQIAQDETTAQLSQALTTRDSATVQTTRITDPVYQDAAVNAPTDVTALNLNEGALFSPPDLSAAQNFSAADHLTQIQTTFDMLMRPETRPAFVKLPAAFAARISKVQEQIVQLIGGGDKNAPTKNNFADLTRPLILNNQQAGTLSATVVAQTPQGLPVVAFFSNPAAPSFNAATFFVLHAPAENFGALVPGTEIAFMPQDDGLVTLSVKPAIMTSFMAPPLTPFSPEAWPVMNDIYEALNNISPQTAQAFSNMVPSPGRPAIIPPAAMFFIAALRGGDLSSWLGENAGEALKRGGRESLISRLSGDGAAMNRAETVTADWKGMSIPLMWDNQVHKLALYYKQDSSNSKDSPEGGKMVRFVFDLNLDAMGKVQLDGLFRTNKLDLIVRSEAAFSQAMQMQMRQAYVAALEPTEVRGELSFQNKPEQWVTIKADRQKFGTSA